VVYGEVFDFATRKVNRKEVSTRIGIQVRMVDVETSEYVPATGTGEVTMRRRDAFDPGDDVEFALSTVGQATEASLARAVPELMERFGRLRRVGG
jgi:hypothetical protein